MAGFLVFRAAIMGAALALCAGAAHADDAINMAAGESFKQPLEALAAQFEAAGGATVHFSYGTSAALAAQIEKAGGVAAVACAQSWADTLDKEGLIAHASRKDFLGDHLVLIAPADSKLAIAVAPNFPLASILGGAHLALADPDKTQTGRFSQLALAAMGVWDSVAANLSRTVSVRAAVAEVAQGTSALAIVYQTDLQNQTQVKPVGIFPDASHPPIAYTLALGKNAGPAAQKFFDYLQSSAARSAYHKAGFVLLDEK